MEFVFLDWMNVPLRVWKAGFCFLGSMQARWSFRVGPFYAGFRCSGCRALVPPVRDWFCTFVAFTRLWTCPDGPGVGLICRGDSCLIRLFMPGALVALINFCAPIGFVRYASRAGGCWPWSASMMRYRCMVCKSFYGFIFHIFDCFNSRTVFQSTLQ